MPSSSSISQDLYPFSLKLWWRYLIARSESPFKNPQSPSRFLQALARLPPRAPRSRSKPPNTTLSSLNNTFERALVTMHKMPRIWIMYLQTLTHQKLLTRTRRTFDRWSLFVSQKGVPIETSLRVYRRLWTSLAEYYIRRGLHEKARDVNCCDCLRRACLLTRWRRWE
ncbi:hypothetical protein AAHE18_20G007300 [Arachis hypogaea]